MRAAATVLVLVGLLGLAAGQTPDPGSWPSGGGGEPIMRGLDGRAFEFVGESGKIYNVLSEKSHQISMLLKPGKLWDHEGTYISTLGLRYGEHTVAISEANDTLSVTLDNEPLVMRQDQTEQEVILGLAEGEMSLLWQLHRPEYGNAVEITTDFLQIVAWMTAAGTRDEGGVIQPAYLNFDLFLLATPAYGTMTGIIGRTYAHSINGTPEEDDFKFHGVDAEYEMASLFETGHKFCVFGRAHAGGIKARKLAEGASISFPMTASARGLFNKLRAAGRGLDLGRKGSP